MNVLHAKTVVHDNEQVFVTSANLTPNDRGRNIETRRFVRDRTLAKHFKRLIDTGLIVPLPREG